MPSAAPAAYWLERAGRTEAGRDTLVVSGAAGTVVSPEDPWQAGTSAIGRLGRGLPATTA